MADTIHSSLDTQRVYGHLYPLIAELYPDMNILIVTQQDLAEGDQDFESLDFSVMDTCNPPNKTGDMAITEAVTADSKNRLIDILFDYSASERPYIDEETLQASMREDFALFNQVAEEATVLALQESAAVISIDSLFQTIERDTALITLPAQMPSVKTEASISTGLPERYLELQSSSQDWSLFKLGHELHHAVDDHSGSDNDVDYALMCTDVNFAINDLNMRQEGPADIAGALFWDAAAQDGLANPESPALLEIESARAIGSLLKNGNIFNTPSSYYAPSHVTNLAFDPDEPGYASKFNEAALDEASGLPLLINTYADVTAGYAYAKMVKEDIANDASRYSEEDILYFEDIPDDGNIGGHIEKLAYLGQALRVENDPEQDPMDPSYYHGAIHYLRETGGFDTLRFQMKDEYREAFDNLVDDYLEAIPNITNIDDSIDHGIYASYLAGLNVNTIAQAIIGTHATYMQDPENNAHLKQSADAIPALAFERQF